MTQIMPCHLSLQRTYMANETCRRFSQFPVEGIFQNHMREVKQNLLALWWLTIVEVIQGATSVRIRKTLAVEFFARVYSTVGILELKIGLFWVHQAVASVVTFLWLYQGTAYACNPWENFESYHCWYPPKGNHQRDVAPVYETSVHISSSSIAASDEDDTPRSIAATKGTSRTAIIVTVIFDLLYHGLRWRIVCDVRWLNAWPS